LSYDEIRLRLMVVPGWKTDSATANATAYVYSISCRVIFSKGIDMDRTTPTGGGRTGAGSATNPASVKIEDVAQTAHQTTDRIADKAASQVDRLSGTAHRAVNSAADAASSAAEWASAIPEQAKQVQTRLTDAASASIRERPITIVAGALAVGYLLGRLARY
jgi:ElaB/YqjD/DUF883 family membrane-anchored ribosome-binding protein